MKIKIGEKHVQVHCKLKSDVRILAIESSCDETAAAVVEDGSRILSSVIASQIAMHARYGGVVPELASREHLRAIVPTVRLAMEQASTRFEDLAAVAVTEGPGLIGSLLVGITYAKAIAAVHKLPLIAVNHIEGHIHAVASQNPVEFPAMALVVSGGHTHLYEVQEGFRYRLLGKTRDDAAGEAFDKVGKLLGFGYPGGPIIDLLAPHGNPRGVKFSMVHMKGNTLDFSFSGLKTAVMNHVRKHPDSVTADIAASFQMAVVDSLVAKARRAAREVGAKGLVLGGGVAANSLLRQRWATACDEDGIQAFVPSRAMCTDNAAMIAAAGWYRLKSDGPTSLDCGAYPGLRLPLVQSYTP